LGNTNQRFEKNHWRLAYRIAKNLKRLYLFNLKSFLGPFVATLFVSLFILLMQFFWKYIDDLMGKGLGLNVILELIVYISAGLIPLALPLTVLLSSIMTTGNLAENNELTALKSSGLSLSKILRPLFVFIVIISGITFYFSNYVIPSADLKAKALIYDIQNTKFELMFKPGTFIKDIQGYTIKVQEVESNTFRNLTIYDETKPNIIRIIKAKSGAVFHEPGGSHLLFQLTDGHIHEEMPSSPAMYTNEGKLKQPDYFPSRKYNFESSTFKVALSGFDINRTDESLFIQPYELMNVFQLSRSVDTALIKQDTLNHRFAQGHKSQTPYFLSLDFLRQNDFLEDFVDTVYFPLGEYAVSLDSLNESQLSIAKTDAAASLRIRMNNLDGQISTREAHRIELRQIQTEFHKKFALSYSVLVLFLIGAPLGAIVRKGGFGLPVVAAVLLFLIYYVLTMVGGKHVESRRYSTCSWCLVELDYPYTNCIFGLFHCLSRLIFPRLGGDKSQIKKKVMKVLVLTHKPPFPKIDGGCIATAQLISGLQQDGIDYKLALIYTQKHPFTETAFPDEISSRIVLTHFIKTDRLLQNIKAFLNSQHSIFTARFFDQKFADALIDLCIQEQPDVIHFESLFAAVYFDALENKNIRQICFANTQC
jgi:lipopolysaccharide export system permease protein